MRGIPFGLLALGVVTAGSACNQEFEPPDRSARVERALDDFAAEVFDTVQWRSEDARLEVGNAIYAERCRRCHGVLGRGETDYAGNRGLVVPTLVGDAWRLANVDSLRRKVYVGHETGMPIFGDGDLDLREIDAVAGYILLSLRPDVLGRG